MTWRGLDRSDLPAWFSLVQSIQDFDREHERETWASLVATADRPYVDLGKDVLAAVDSDGSMLAVGRNAFRPDPEESVRVTFIGGVRPEWRGRGLGRELLSWQLLRAGQNVEHLRQSPRAEGLPALIGGYVEDHLTDRSRLFAAAGFTPTRWFDEMTRDLEATPPRPEVSLPDGLDVVGLGPDVSERTRLAHNEAFRDHWGSNPISLEDWAAECSAETFRPAMSLAVIDTAQAGHPVVAYAMNFEYEDDWESMGHSEGYTGLLGVTRPWRGRGLASELLHRTAALFAAAGHPYATLGVDSDSPTSAGALYESLGYERLHRTTYWSLPVG